MLLGIVATTIIMVIMPPLGSTIILFAWQLPL